MIACVSFFWRRAREVQDKLIPEGMRKIPRRTWPLGEIPFPGFVQSTPREEAGLKPGDHVVYKADHGRIEVVKISGLREAFSRKKIAKITFEEFENRTGEVLGE